MSPGPNYEENQSTNPTFLATLQTILAVLEDDVSPAIPENTYLTLVNNLQILYGIHSTSVTNSGTINSGTINMLSGMGRGATIDSSNSYTSNSYTSNSYTSNSYTSTINNNNIANFTNALSSVEIMYDNMSYVERGTTYENNTYNNLMNVARDYWQSMSSDEQRNYRTNMRRDGIEFGGPVHRIIYPRS